MRLPLYWDFPIAQMVKNPSAMQETQIRSLGQEDPLEKKMATPSSVRTWIIPWTGSLVFYSPWGCEELDMTNRLTHTHTLLEIYPMI